MSKIYDVIGIGFGPANIALAIALEEFGFSGSQLFLEKRDSAYWQPEMLLPGSDIQNHPCRDLVTPRNPRSRYSFMNFLFEHDRLFEHLNLGLEFPLRREYAQYVSWAASFFNQHVRYSCSVTALEQDPADAALYLVHTDGGEVLRARSVVVAPGRTPLIPAEFAGCDPARVFHLTEFMSRSQALAARGELNKIGVLGGSQSAAELLLYLRNQYPHAEIHSVMRGYGFRLKDTSQFSDHVYFPEFVDYYFNASKEAKRRINKHLHTTNYSAVDGDVISALYTTLYEDRLKNERHLHIHGSSEVLNVAGQEGRLDLTLREMNTGETTRLPQLDALVLATGFKNFGTSPNEERCPALLNTLYPQLQQDEEGVLAIQRDYRLLPAAQAGLPPLYLNGLCESSHGYGDAGSFSLLALRSAEIYRSLAKALSHAPALV